MLVLRMRWRGLDIRIPAHGWVYKPSLPLHPSRNPNPNRSTEKSTYQSNRSSANHLIKPEFLSLRKLGWIQYLRSQTICEGAVLTVQVKKVLRYAKSPSSHLAAERGNKIGMP